MRVSVIGCGHLGAPHAAAMAELGHQVLGVELDPDKCQQLNSGRAPFYERDLDALLAQHTTSGRLRFTTDIREAARFAALHFVAVGTPLRPDEQGGYDDTQLITAIRHLVPLLPGSCTIVGKSTVTVGTVARLQDEIDALTHKTGVQGVDLVWNPEFLREGHAVEDSLYPDRIIAGLTTTAAQAAIEEVYAPILDSGSAELIVTSPATAEVLKSAANSFLTTKISFINAIAEVCEITGADVATIAHGIGIDPRIGPQGMRPGIGYGGGCLPKDVRAFTHRARQLGATHAADLLDAVHAVNTDRLRAAVHLIEHAHQAPLKGARIAMLGATFKAGTSDVRDSPALNLAEALHRLGAIPVVYDPEGLDAAVHYHPHLTYAHDALSAMKDTSLVVLATEWPVFTHDPQLPAAGAGVVRRRTLVDVRTAVQEQPWLQAGWTIWQLGRPVQRPH